MKGFTLIEIMVATVILLFLIAAGFTMLYSGNDAWFTSSASVTLRQEIIKTFMRMERDLKGTRPSQINLTIGTNSSSLSFKVPQDNNNDGTILDSSGNVEWSNSITYSLNGAKQIIRNASGTTTVLANNITSLRFTRPVSPGNFLQIDITAQKTSVSKRLLNDTEQYILKMRN